MSDLGVAGVPVTIDNQTITTSSKVKRMQCCPWETRMMCQLHHLVEFRNASRIVFNGWRDGNNQTERSVVLDGDMRLAGSYRMQYLLQVNSPVSP